MFYVSSVLVHVMYCSRTVVDRLRVCFNSWCVTKLNQTSVIVPVPPLCVCLIVFRLSTTVKSVWELRSRTSLWFLTPAPPTSGCRRPTASARPVVPQHNTNDTELIPVFEFVGQDDPTFKERVPDKSKVSLSLCPQLHTDTSGLSNQLHFIMMVGCLVFTTDQEICWESWPETHWRSDLFHIKTHYRVIITWRHNMSADTSYLCPCVFVSVSQKGRNQKVIKLRFKRVIKGRKCSNKEWRKRILL